MQTHFLSSQERDLGIKNLYRATLFNGLGFAYLGPTVIYLLAIQFEATNIQLGYISSAVHFSGLILFIAPLLLGNKNFGRAATFIWFLRGGVCIAYVALLFLEGQQAVFLILTVYTLFCAFRSLGVSLLEPMQKNLTTKRNIGETVANLNLRFQPMGALSQIVSFIILSIQQLSGIVGLLILELLGVITNTIASVFVGKIPSRQKVPPFDKKSFATIFRSLKSNRERFRIIAIRGLGFSILTFHGFIIPFLRRVAQIPPNLVFVYTIVAFILSAMAGIVISPFADKIGTKPLLILTFLSTALLALGWSVIPDDSPFVVFLVAGGILQFFIGLSIILLNKLVINVIPEENPLGFSSFVNIIVAIFALVSGIIAGLLADLSESHLLGMFNSYGLVFIALSVMSLMTLALSSSLKDPGSLSLRDTMGLLFSTRNLRSFLVVQALNTETNPEERKAILYRLSASKTAISDSEIKRILASPLSAEKREMLHHLMVHPRKALYEQILTEARDDHSYLRNDAIFALGGYPGEETKRLLVSYLDSPDPILRSNAAKSLGRIGANDLLDRIVELHNIGELPSVAHLNFFIARILLDNNGDYLSDVLRIGSKTSEGFAQSCYSLVSEMNNVEPPLRDIYRDERLRKHSGIHIFLDEARQFAPFLQQRKVLLNLLKEKHYDGVCKWALHELRQHEQRWNGKYLLANNYRSILESEHLSNPRYSEAIFIIHFLFLLFDREKKSGIY